MEKKEPEVLNILQEYICKLDPFFTEITLVIHGGRKGEKGSAEVGRLITLREEWEKGAL